MKKNKFPGIDLEQPVAIKVTCYGCKRVTEIWTSNAIALILKCQVCGATGFKRDVLVNDDGK